MDDTWRVRGGGGGGGGVELSNLNRLLLLPCLKIVLRIEDGGGGGGGGGVGADEDVLKRLLLLPVLKILLKIEFGGGGGGGGGGAFAGTECTGLFLLLFLKRF